MSDGQIFDLDVLKPEPVYVKLLGHKFDVSFVPAIVALKIERLQNQLAALDEHYQDKSVAEKAADEEYVERTLDLMTDVVMLVASAQVPDLSKERLMRECTIGQINEFITLVYRHMYGPRSREVIDKALADQANGDGKQVPSKKGATTGRRRSADAPSSTNGRQATASSS